MGNEELWAEWAIGAAVMILRYLVRWRTIGFAKFTLDDLFIGIGLVMYTAITAIIDRITVYGSPIGQTAESVYLLPPEMVASFEIGGKLTFADWLIYIFYTWSLKSALLVMNWRLTNGLYRERLLTKIVIGFNVAAFIGAFLAHICGCLPISHNWQVVPYPGDECILRTSNYYVITIFNALSDFAIIIIPIPVLFKVQLSMLRRLLLGVLLCSGLFVIIATTLRAYYSLGSLTQLPVAAGWTSRELFVAALAVSAPGIKPLFSSSKWFRSLGSSHARDAYAMNSHTKGNSKVDRTIGGGHVNKGFEMGKPAGAQRLGSDTGSEEHIIGDGSGDGRWGDKSTDIRVTNETKVSFEAARS